MPLETLRPDARTSVKRITVETEESKPEQNFDVDKEIDPQLLEKIYKWGQDFTNLDGPERWSPGCGDFFGDYLFLLGEKGKQGLKEMPNFLPNLKKQMDHYLERLIQEKDETRPITKQWIRYFLDLALVMKFLFPNEFEQFSIAPEVRNHLMDYYNHESGNLNSKKLFILKEIAPDVFDEIPEEARSWESWAESITRAKKEGFWDAIIKESAYLKLLFPNEFKGYEFSKEDWVAMKKVFDDRESRYLGFVDKDKDFSAQDGWDLIKVGGALNVLAAHDAHLTDKGLEIKTQTQKEKFDKKSSKTPQVKQY